MNTFKVTDKHLAVINTALEVYYRLRSGQINMALDAAFNYSIDRDELDIIEKLIRKSTHNAKRVAMGLPKLPTNAAYGFNSPEIGDAVIACEILKTIEEYLAVKNNDGFYGSTVNFRGPLKASDEPLPIILEHKNYKDYMLNKKQSAKINKLYATKDFNKMWEYVDSLKLNLPKGEKTEIVSSLKGVTIRVTKPRLS